MFIRTVFLCLIALSLQVNATPKDQSLSNQQCVYCHQQVTADWQKSDHAKAMAIADKSTVLGDFNNKNVSHYGQEAFFFKQKNQYMVTISLDDNQETLAIKYTFGHFPLQQYIVETEPGRLQILPFAWNSKPSIEGGQDWYHIYRHEKISTQDRLHWRQPLQNWNGMCADCHSDGLVRNYDIEKNKFNSQWDNINVGCLSCHGDMSKHAELHQSTTTIQATIPAEKGAAASGKWWRELNQNTAHWQGGKRDNRFMDNCFSCHALRAPLTDGMTANQPFLDQFSPQLLSAPMYYVDGQIKEEVYVYGSFLQSKMFAAGVNCLDCHDKHTMKLKIAGNGLCLQCHNSQKYNVKQHHQHQDNTAGAQCVNCHMTQNRYMGVDDRRDHSFKIPRPDVSINYGTPNACVKCHTEQDDQWALQIITKWHGETKLLSKTRESYYLLHSGQQISLAHHLAIIADEQLDIITRATALQLLRYTTNELTSVQLAHYLSHKEDLIRLAAANSAELLPIQQRVKLVSPLLNDPLKAIRLAAARSIIDAELPVQDMPIFREAYIELQSTNDINSWRGEGRLNQGMLDMRSNNAVAAEQSFKSAINIDPYFEAGYINLADFYRSQQQPAQVMSVLTRGMSKLAESALLKYSYGLHLIRQQQRDKATAVFQQAMLLDPTNQQYLYTYILSLDGIGKTTIALKKLKLLLPQYPVYQQLKELGLYLAKKENNIQEYKWFMAQ